MDENSGSHGPTEVSFRLFALEYQVSIQIFNFSSYNSENLKLFEFHSKFVRLNVVKFNFI